MNKEKRELLQATRLQQTTTTTLERVSVAIFGTFVVGSIALAIVSSLGVF